MRAGFGGGCGRAASRRRREREEKVTTWDSNGSWSRWSPWPRLSPPYYVKTARSHAVRRRRMPVPSRFTAAATWMPRWRSAVTR
jgi:hypothetical protein